MDNTQVQVPSVSLKGCDKAMPVIGMGTASYPPANPEAAKAAILEAIKAGYRHFDTASAYGSEPALGQAIAEALKSGLILSRDQLFITTKLWASEAEKTLVLPACKTSLQNLGLEYVDMYLIHWPVRLLEKVKTTPVAAEIIGELDVKGVWEGMEECKKLGFTKGIGVSNFPCKMLHQLLGIANIPPAINQVQMNPFWQQKQLREFCRAQGVHVTAYSPLGANNTRWGDSTVVQSEVLQTIAKAKGKTTAQVALRWAYEQQVSLVVKSFNKDRMQENMAIFNWRLSAQDFENMDHLQQRKGATLASVMGPHPLLLDLDAQL